MIGEEIRKSNSYGWGEIVFSKRKWMNVSDKSQLTYSSLSEVLFKKSIIAVKDKLSKENGEKS